MNASERLDAVRHEMRPAGVDGLLVPRADEHLSEYVPPSAERLAWLTGFTGSAGLAVVLADEAAVWSDGRYVLQLADQTDPALWQRLHVTEQPPPVWIAARIGGGKLGYDPWLISEDALRPYREAGIELTPLPRNPIDLAWADRPAPPSGPAVPHDLVYAGRNSAEKREEIAASLRQAGQDAAVISDPASLAWLLNIRGNDVETTPFALGFAVARDDANVDLFMDPAKLPPDTRAWLGNAVSIAPRDALLAALQAFRGKRVRVDSSGSPAWFAQTLRDAGAIVVAGSDPCLLPKACKNEVEQAGARAAHIRDGAAVTRFLAWLRTAPGRETELSAAQRLHEFRAEAPLFRDDSFPAISGAGEHGAVIHYRVTPESDRAIKPNEVYLIDSGGQYLDGTTDITRTVWTGPDAPPAEIRDRYTRVLKGHIALASAVFPEGVAGVRLDVLARNALWQAGLDYDHGTGHGVGSYLSVHEGPVSISPHLRPATVAAGMILSNEPGFYLPGGYGIRIENLLVVQRADIASAKPFLCFETLTLAPLDRTLIEPSLLLEHERRWVDAYHTRVLDQIEPLLAADDAAFLRASCEPL